MLETAYEFLTSKDRSVKAVTDSKMKELLASKMGYVIGFIAGVRLRQTNLPKRSKSFLISLILM